MKPSKRETIYAWLMLIVALFLLGSCGAIENELISFTQGLIQIAASVVVGLILSFGIWHEETKAARRRR